MNYNWRLELVSCAEEHLINAELNYKHKRSHYLFANNRVEMENVTATECCLLFIFVLQQLQSTSVRENSLALKETGQHVY